MKLIADCSEITPDFRSDSYALLIKNNLLCG